jgi:hypothetical protein
MIKYCELKGGELARNYPVSSTLGFIWKKKVKPGKISEKIIVIRMRSEQNNRDYNPQGLMTVLSKTAR